MLTKDLSRGSESNEVLSLQQFLTDNGYLMVKPNGYFGQNTRNAVIAFQSQQKLSRSGLVGPLTRQKIKEVSCGTSSLSSSKKATTSDTVAGGITTSVTKKDVSVVGTTQETNSTSPLQQTPTISVKTFLAESITKDGATLKGKGGIDGERHWFQWGKSMDMTEATPQTIASTTYSYKLTGLTPNTSYYFRAVTSIASSTTRKEEVAYGDMRYFTTPPAEVAATVLPTVTISSSGVAVDSNGSAKVVWSSTNANTCSFTQGESGGTWTSQTSLSGQYVTLPMTQAATFIIHCKNLSGYTVTGSVTVPKITP